MEKTRELAIEILEEFEDLLAEHNIIIPDGDREGDDEEACIYGSTYYTLEDKMTELIKNSEVRLNSIELLKAIESNYTSGKVNSNIKDGTEFCGVVVEQYISEEVENLRNSVFECKECEDGYNLVKNHECLHCGNTEVKELK